MAFYISRISNILIEGVDPSDLTDTCDAFIAYAEYDGVRMTDEQIEELNEDFDFVQEQALKLQEA